MPATTTTTTAVSEKTTKKNCTRIFVFYAIFTGSMLSTGLPVGPFAVG